MNQITNYEDIGRVFCPAEEQETTISWSRADNIARIWSSDNTFITKIKRKMKSSPANWKCFEGSKNAHGDVTGYFFECPRKLVSLRASTRAVKNTFQDDCDVDDEFDDFMDEGEEEYGID